MLAFSIRSWIYFGQKLCLPYSPQTRSTMPQKKKKKSTSQINIELKYVSSLEEMREEDSINLPLHEA